MKGPPLGPLYRAQKELRKTVVDPDPPPLRAGHTHWMCVCVSETCPQRVHTGDGFSPHLDMSAFPGYLPASDCITCRLAEATFIRVSTAPRIFRAWFGRSIHQVVMGTCRGAIWPPRTMGLTPWRPTGRPPPVSASVFVCYSRARAHPCIHVSEVYPLGVHFLGLRRVDFSSI